MPCGSSRCAVIDYSDGRGRGGATVGCVHGVVSHTASVSTRLVYLVTYNGSLSRLRWVRYEAGDIVAYPVGGCLI